MSDIPTSPDLKSEIADVIRAHRKRRDNGGESFTAYVKVREEAGRFTTVGGATVLIEAVVEFTPRYLYPNAGDEHHVEVAVRATCHGHGCIDPRLHENGPRNWLLDEDPDKPAEALLLCAQRAREWAQAHAAKCRAQAYTG
jgi:hypothetical protein